MHLEIKLKYNIEEDVIHNNFYAKTLNMCFPYNIVVKSI